VGTYRTMVWKITRPTENPYAKLDGEVCVIADTAEEALSLARSVMTPSASNVTGVAVVMSNVWAEGPQR